MIYNYRSDIVYPKNKRLFWRSYGLKREIKEQGIDIYHGLSNEIPFYDVETFGENHHYLLTPDIIKAININTNTI